MTEREFQFGDDCAEAFRLSAALQDAGKWPSPPARFYDRCVQSLLEAQHTPCAARRTAMRRAAKIAASFAAFAAFASLASWIAAERFSASETEDAEMRHVDEETEMITSESSNNMIARKMASIVGAALTTLSVGATEVTSEPTFVFLRPETSSFWHTATNSVMTIPIDYPAGADSATLSVSGVDYSRTYENLTCGEFTLALPPAENPGTENVYGLTLEFNDAAHTVRNAKLGLIQGLSPDASGTTRCLAPVSGKVWENVKGRAVLPIPYGTTSFAVNGEQRDTGLGGAQGWYALHLKGGETVSLSLIANEIPFSADLCGSGGGFILIFR